jgi:hypothetical protein
MAITGTGIGPLSAAARRDDTSEEGREVRPTGEHFIVISGATAA